MKINPQPPVQNVARAAAERVFVKQDVKIVKPKPDETKSKPDSRLLIVA